MTTHEDNIDNQRRKLLGGIAAAGVASTAGCTSAGRDDFLPNINSESFKSQTEALNSKGRRARSRLEEMSIQDLPVSLDSNDYGGRGFAVTDGIRLAVPEDGQSHHIRGERDGATVDFYLEEGTEDFGGEVEDMVRDLTSDRGLTSRQEESISNGELIDAVTNIQPYVEGVWGEDGAQPDLSDEQLEAFDDVREELTEFEGEYLETLTDLGDSIRELSQQKNTLNSAERSSRSRWPLSHSYDEETHFLESEANEYAAEIADVEEELQETYEQGVREWATVSSARRAMDSIAGNLDELQDTFAEGDYDETGQERTEDPEDDWKEYDNLSSCNQDRADDFYGDEASDLQYRETDEGFISYRSPDAPEETSGDFEACVLGE